jgi:chromosome segregation ATPase
VTKIAFALLFFVAWAGFGQTPAKDPDTLQALLVEVRQLRQDIEAMTVASQRVQIALYGLQMQDAAVARAAQRVDNVRNKCSGVQVNKDHQALEVQRLENSLTSGKLSEVETRDIQLALAQRKGEVEAITMEAQTCQATEAEASSQLRNEQAKLVDLQDRIEHLDKTLEKLGAAGK